MSNNFTPRSQQALAFAKKEAEALGDSFIGTHHLLLGLLKLGQGVASNVLFKLGIEIKDIHDSLIDKTDIDKEKQTLVKNQLEHSLPYSKGIQEVISSAQAEAKQMNIVYIGTEHLLLGLLKVKNCAAYKVLTNLDISFDEVKDEIFRELDPNFQSPEPVLAGEVSNPKSGSKKKSNLKQFTVDMTEMARSKKFDPVIGREAEIDRAIQILGRRTKNNPILIGEAGVGKTAIAEGLAQKIVNKQVPSSLLEKRILSLDIGSVVAGTIYRGQFEERIKSIMDEAKKDKNIIFFIDELHMIVGAGSASGTLDASNIFKPALSRGEFQCIGATTFSEYKKHIEKDAALERRFQQIKIEPPTIEQTISILNGIKSNYEEYHRVVYTDEAIIASCELSDRYITNRYFPDKAIDLLDEAGSKARSKIERFDFDTETHQNRLEQLQEEKTLSIKAQKFEKAASLRDEEKKLKVELQQKYDQWKNSSQNEVLTISKNDIAEIISLWTGVPVTKITEKETAKLLNLEKDLQSKVIGQVEAIAALSRALKRARVDFKDPNRPIGSFLFLGPTGVGKTYLTKILTETMYVSKKSLIQIDMSEYMEKFSLSRLIGSPPGYVGHDEGGQLTEAVRKNPYSVILFDEIEKAHPDISHLLLQILEEGKITDSLGRMIDFKNTIIILTSNLGAESFSKPQEKLGFGGYLSLDSDIDTKVLEQTKSFFKPEFLNRLDKQIVFKRLEKTHIKQILEIELKKLKEKLRTKKINIEFHASAKEFLVEKGFSETYGARPLKRLLEEQIEDVIVDEILKESLTENVTLVFSKLKNNEKINFKIKLCS